ncbi:hypothetical protein AR540_12595 [Pseudomonas sp. EpS/L25]|nr:hypothetical protein AR540_12595 [Pseudomonas sp. EpS/L25]
MPIINWSTVIFAFNCNLVSNPRLLKLIVNIYLVRATKLINNLNILTNYYTFIFHVEKKGIYLLDMLF